MVQNKLQVCDLALFDAANAHFWMGPLQGLLENFPVLEAPHTQDFYTLLFIGQAEGEIVIDDDQIPMDQSLFAVIKPGCINKLKINKKARGTIIVFSENFFSLRYNNNTLHQFSFLKRGVKPYLRLKDTLVEHFELVSGLMYQAFSNPQKDRVHVLRSYLNIVLFDLDRNWPHHKAWSGHNQHSERLLKFETLIEAHFHNWKTPSEYAIQLAVTANYLNKLCKRELGITAGEMIRKRIIIEAQRLLHYTYMTVNDVAAKLGFENTSYFITFFKKYTGFTPEQFRKS